MFIVPVSRRAIPASRSLDRLFDDAVDRFFGVAATAAASDGAPVRRPAVDVAETDTQYVLTLDVPGVTREDVKVEIDGRRVSFVAEARKAEAAASPEAAEGVEAAPQPRVVVQERAVASFARSFTFAKEIDQAASQARLENGVLTLTLAKRAPSASQLAVN